MKFTTLILYDVLSCILFFPITKMLFKYTNIDKFFINFKIFHLKPKDKLYNIFYNCRGNNYNLDSKQSKNDKNHYFITTWSILHAIYFFIRGLFIPNLFIYHLLYSVIFETVEIYFKCHDVVDVIINMIFYYFGSITSPNLSKIPFIKNIPILKIK